MLLESERKKILEKASKVFQKFKKEMVSKY